MNGIMQLILNFGEKFSNWYNNLKMNYVSIKRVEGILPIPFYKINIHKLA